MGPVRTEAGADGVMLLTIDNPPVNALSAAVRAGIEAAWVGPPAAVRDTVGADVPLLGQIPLDVSLREGSDQGAPAVLSNPDGPAAVALADAEGLPAHARSISVRLGQ